MATTNWTDIGSLMEREKIGVMYTSDDKWKASCTVRIAKRVVTVTDESLADAVTRCYAEVQQTYEIFSEK